MKAIYHSHLKGYIGRIGRAIKDGQDLEDLLAKIGPFRTAIKQAVINSDGTFAPYLNKIINETRRIDFIINDNLIDVKASIANIDFGQAEVFIKCAKLNGMKLHYWFLRNPTVHNNYKKLEDLANKYGVELYYHYIEKN